MNLASHADVRTGAETREEPLRTSAREATMNEDRHFSFGRDDNILALSTLNLRGLHSVDPHIHPFFVEYKTIGAQKREFLSKKYYCCRTLEVVPKSYRPKGQPRSTRNEFPIRADFGNSRKHPIWRLKRGKNWQPKEPFYSQRSVIYGNVDAVCVYSEFWSVLCPV